LIPPDIAKEAGVKIACSIASNNYEAGKIAAEFIANKMGGKGKVAVLEGAPGAKTGLDRKQGFLDVISTFDGIQVVSSQPANWDRNKAFEVTTNILQAHPDLGAIFAANDTMALGAGEAVKAAGIAQGKIIIIGVDGIPDARKAIKEGTITGTVAQYPYVMGQLGVLSAYNLAKGREWPRFISAPVQLLLKEDIKD
jgi:ribose transport system substrate-binding protein